MPLENDRQQVDNDKLIVDMRAFLLAPVSKHRDSIQVFDQTRLPPVRNTGQRKPLRRPTISFDING